MTPLNFALKDAVKGLFPKVDPKKDYAAFFAVNVGSGFLAGLLALPVGCAVSWPVLRAKADLRPDATRLTASQHLRHMWATPGPTLSLIARAMPLAALGIPLFRGIYFGVNDTLRAYNPYQKAGGAVGLFSKVCVAQVASLSVLGGAASAPKPPFTHHPQRQRRAIQREGARASESRRRGVSVAPVQRVSSQAVTAAYPMSVVIDRYVVANYEASAGIAHVAKAAMEGQGVAGLFRGYPSKVSTHVGSALILVLYGELKSLLYKSKPPDERIKRQRAATETEAPRRRRDAARPSPPTMSPASDEERYGFAPKPADNVSDGEE